MQERNALISTASGINPGEEVAVPSVGSGAGLGLCWSFPEHGITPFPSLSRGDQCFTNNVTYLEIIVGDATLVKNGEQRLSPSPCFHMH